MNEVGETVALEIRKRPGACGGRARMGETRIPVWSLVAFRRDGVGDAKLLEFFPQLTEQHLRLAWEYYESHKAEIERDIQEQRADDGETSNG